MTNVAVHRSVVADLRKLKKADASAAQAATAFIRKLRSSPQRGRKLEQPGWRAYEVAADVVLIASGVGTGTIRVLGVASLPTVYNAARLHSMAEAAMPPSSGRARQRTSLPAPAGRSRLISLADAESTQSYRDRSI